MFSRVLPVGSWRFGWQLAAGSRMVMGLRGHANREPTERGTGPERGKQWTAVLQTGGFSGLASHWPPLATGRPLAKALVRGGAPGTTGVGPRPGPVLYLSGIFLFSAAARSLVSPWAAAVSPGTRLRCTIPRYLNDTTQVTQATQASRPCPFSCPFPCSSSTTLLPINSSSLCPWRQGTWIAPATNNWW